MPQSETELLREEVERAIREGRRTLSLPPASLTLVKDLIIAPMPELSIVGTLARLSNSNLRSSASNCLIVSRRLSSLLPKGDRNDAAGSAKGAAEAARRQSAELWAYYQTAAGERVSMELARDRIRLDLMKRGITRDDPEAKMDALKLTDYEERVRDFDRQTTQVFYRVQELEQQEDVQQRRAVEPSRAVFRYELGGKLITLALILLSVTILSSKRWLLWAGVALGSIGLLVAFDGYFLFL